MKKTAYLAIFLSLYPSTHCVIKFSNKHSGLSFLGENSQLILETSMSGVNGTILFKDNSPTRIITNDNSTITFTDGVTGTPGGEYSFTGTYNLSSSNTLTLNDGDTLLGNGTSVYQQIQVASGASATISGNIIFDQNPILDSGASITLALDNELEASFSPQGLNTITLARPLELGSKTSLNTGTLDTLDLSGQDVTFNGVLSQINQIIGSGTIYLQYATYPLTYNLNISGAIDLCANGSTLAVSNASVVNFGPSVHSVFDLKLKGLGQGNSLTVASGGTVLFNGTTLELSDNLTLAGQGTYVFTADNCTIIPNGYQIFLDNGTTFVVDNCNLFYVQSNPLETNPIVVINSGSGPGILSYSGPLAAIVSTTKGLAILDNYVVTGTNFSLTNNFDLTQLSSLTFTNATPATPKNTTLSGNGFSINFPSGTSNDPLLNLDPNIALIVSASTFKGFSTNLINKPASSAFLLANGNNLFLQSDQTLVSTFPLTFSSGNSLIDGYGHCLILNSDALVTLGSSTTTTIKNCTLAINSPNPFLLSDNSSTLIFQDCNIVLGASGWNIPAGNLQFSGRNQILGANQTILSQLVPVVFSSSGSLTVNTLSNLVINRDISFSYQANPVNDLGVTANSKRHLKLADQSATLELNGCTVVSTPTALALDYGKLIVRDLVVMQVDPGAGHEVEIGTALEVDILAGATWDVRGPLRQIQTTFP